MTPDPMHAKPSLLHEKFLRARLSSATGRALVLSDSINIGSTSSVLEAIALMDQKNVGCILVLDQSEKVVGVFTERDVLTQVTTNEINLKNTKMSDAMTAKPITMRPSASIARALLVLSQNSFRHLPLVTGEGQAAGLVSVRDMLDFICRQLTKSLAQSTTVVNDRTQVEGFLTSRVETLNLSSVIMKPENASISEVSERLLSGGVGAIMLANNEPKITGIFTERDFLQQVSTSWKNLKDRPISNVMTNNPRTLKNTATISQAFNTMSEGGFRQVPVVDTTGTPIGFLTVKTLIEHLGRGLLQDLGQ